MQRYVQNQSKKVAKNKIVMETNANKSKDKEQQIDIFICPLRKQRIDKAQTSGGHQGKRNLRKSLYRMRKPVHDKTNEEKHQTNDAFFSIAKPVVYKCP